jgi:hypothetical protein
MLFFVLLMLCTCANHEKKMGKLTMRANKCLLYKQIIFKLFSSTNKFHYIDSYSLLFFEYFHSNIAIWFLLQYSTLAFFTPYIHRHSIKRHTSLERYSKTEVKKMHIDGFNLCKTLYGVVVYMITIFRNLSTKLCH